jgi:ribonuclease D
MPRPSDSSGSKPFRPYAPTHFRSRSHDSAHAEQVPDEQTRVIHPLISHGSPEFVDRPDSFNELLDHLRSSGRFAYDSEFIGELTYIPKLCLIQVATSQRVALIDPLAGLELKRFWDLICDPSVEKIVHAGQQDIEPVYRNAGCAAVNVFDTQVCAGFIGLAYPVALSKLVNEIAGARIGKGLTFTHWDQRPLSAMQLRYAADDVRYLLVVRDEIGKRLETLGHTAWARQECDAMCEPTQYGFHPDTHFLRIRGAVNLSPRNQAVLRELTIWRDDRAREHNVPARAFLKDEVLLDLARTPLKSVDRLAGIRGLPRPVEQAHGAELIAATAQGLATSVENLPQSKDVDPTPQQRFRADALWSTVQCLCAGRSIDPALVTSRQEIGELYRSTASGEAPGNLRLLRGWRREAVGQSAVDFLAGKSKLDLGWTDTLQAQTGTAKK